MAKRSPPIHVVFIAIISYVSIKYANGFPQPVQPYVSMMNLYSSLQPIDRTHRSIPTIGATMYVPKYRRHSYTEHVPVYDTDMYQQKQPQRPNQNMFVIPRGFEESKLGDDRILKTIPDEEDFENETGDSEESDDNLMYAKMPQTKSASRQFTMQVTPPVRRQRPVFGLHVMDTFDTQPQYDEYEFNNGYATMPQKRYQPHHTYFSQPVPIQYQHPNDHMVYSEYPQQLNMYLIEPEQQRMNIRRPAIKTETDKKKKSKDTPKVIVLEKIEEASDGDEQISVEELFGEDSAGDILMEIKGIKVENKSNEENLTKSEQYDSEDVQEKETGADLGHESTDEHSEKSDDEITSSDMETSPEQPAENDEEDSSEESR